MLKEGRLEEPWEGCLELFLSILREGRKDLFEGVLELRRHTVVVPLLVEVLGVVLVVVGSTASWRSHRRKCMHHRIRHSSSPRS